MVNKKEAAGTSGEGQTQTPDSDLQARNASKEIRRKANMLVYKHSLAKTVEERGQNLSTGYLQLRAACTQERFFVHLSLPTIEFLSSLVK